jgi:hypothetical protein
MKLSPRGFSDLVLQYANTDWFCWLHLLLSYSCADRSNCVTVILSRVRYSIIFLYSKFNPREQSNQEMMREVTLTKPYNCQLSLLAKCMGGTTCSLFSVLGSGC